MDLKTVGDLLMWVYVVRTFGLGAGNEALPVMTLAVRAYDTPFRDPADGTVYDLKKFLAKHAQQLSHGESLRLILACLKELAEDGTVMKDAAKDHATTTSVLLR